MGMKPILEAGKPRLPGDDRYGAHGVDGFHQSGGKPLVVFVAPCSVDVNKRKGHLQEILQLYDAFQRRRDIPLIDPQKHLMGIPEGIGV
jgi:hypothetical protein